MNRFNNKPRNTRPPLEVIERLLASRAHTRAELRSKMKQRGYQATEIEAALARAEELCWLEPDEALANRAAEYQRQKTGATPATTRARLAARGLNSEAVEAAVKAAFSDWNALEAAWLLVEREKDPARAARRLMRKGFSADVISRVVRRLGTSVEDT